ncbi:hypothetical protein [uncultured Campylobacter sp.]|uniref:hypothetical protein n=1 Tax=uncultured Campylobacter sp. TaxID=218934 RepID=UPI00261B3BC8|nr:hypothetical protein [uncultured Campylobacter sp.]
MRRIVDYPPQRVSQNAPIKIALRRGLIKSRLAQTQRNARKSKIRGLQNQAAAFKSELKLLEF